MAHRTKKSVVGVVVGVLVIALLGPALIGHNSSSCTVKGAHSPVVTKDDISGVTGKLFKNVRRRSFPGSSRFRSASPHPGGVGVADSPWKRWAVCTTINEPTKAITDLANQSDWAVVIVGDVSTPPFHLSGAHAVYLDPSDQRAIATEHAAFFELLPWKHFGRKNVGYLYAIAHGAEMIWDFDDDNYLKAGIQPHVPTAVSSVELPTSCTAFNPYPLMGSPMADVAAWPRGFPLNFIRSPCNYSLGAGDASTVAVFQSLADHEPDVDGIYRLTRTTPFYFDTAARMTLVIPEGTLVPYNAQATLLLQPALWSALLPVTVHGRVSDIWRSYWTQRLLWDVGRRIAFTPPWVTQYRNPHNPLADMSAENDLYFKSLALVEYLKMEWDSDLPSLPGRFEQLLIDLYEHGYVEIQDVELTQAWIDCLLKIGYHFPLLRGP